MRMLRVGHRLPRQESHSCHPRQEIRIPAASAQDPHTEGLLPDLRSYTRKFRGRDLYRNNLSEVSSRSRV